MKDVENATGSSVTYYDQKGGLNSLNGDSMPMDFTEDLMLVNFKRLMEENILPYLKKNRDNDFLNGLVLRQSTDKERSWISTRVRMNRLIDIKNLDLLFTYQKGFDSLAEDNITIKLGKNTFRVDDLFFLYNLVVNKDRFGSDRLTKLFGKYVSNPNNNIPKSLYTFYSDLDSGDSNLFDETMPLNDEMVKVVEFGVFNVNGSLKITEDTMESEGITAKLPNKNFTLATSFTKLANNHQNVSTYEKLLKHINNKNLLIEFNCE